MKTSEVRQKFIEYYTDKKRDKHREIPSASLVPENDPTTLFTSSGMQPLVQYLLGEPHPLGGRLVNSQKSFRTQDIEEVGDNRHTTFFEMLGNWSLGVYFKKEQLSWLFNFLTQKLGLEPEKLYVTVFEGNESVPKDTESIQIWIDIFHKEGINAKEGKRIFSYPANKNWWSRAGEPNKMPSGEPGGPDSEVFYDFETPHDKRFGKICHPNCDCGRFLEIGNSVFMQYIKNKDGSIKELKQKNVDFGGGLERLVAATCNDPDIFHIDSFAPIIRKIEKISGKSYSESQNKPAMRVIADHLKAATFLISDGVKPSNKERGYILRRLLRRSIVKIHQLSGGMTEMQSLASICKRVIHVYKESPYFPKPSQTEHLIEDVVTPEIKQFGKVLDRGLKKIKQTPQKDINAKFIFNLYQSYGFPFEITQEMMEDRGIELDKKAFTKEFRKHQEISKKGAQKKFAGGLANHREYTIRLHTATHLLHQALRNVLGSHVRQKGSHITTERLRFDFSHPKKMTENQIRTVEEEINKRIQQDIPVYFKTMSLQKALKKGALAFFNERYAEQVKVYFIGPFKDEQQTYSIEVCGGPHVDSTKQLGKLKIVKEESIGSGIQRIYAKLSND